MSKDFNLFRKSLDETIDSLKKRLKNDEIAGSQIDNSTISSKGSMWQSWDKTVNSFKKRLSTPGSYYQPMDNIYDSLSSDDVSDISRYEDSIATNYEVSHMDLAFKEKTTQLQEKIRSLEELLIGKEKEYQTLFAQNEKELKEKEKDLAIERENLDKEIKAHKAWHEEKAHFLKEKQDAEERYRVELVHMQKNLMKEREHFTDLVRQKEEMISKIKASSKNEDIEKKYQELQQKHIEEITKLKNEKNETIEKLSKKISKLTEDSNSETNKLKKQLEQEKEHWNSKLSQKEDEIARIRESQSQINETQYQEIKEKHQKEADNLMKEKNDAVDKLNNRIKTLETSSSNEINLLKQQLEHEQEEWNIKLKLKEEEISDIKMHDNILESKYKQLEQKYASEIEQLKGEKDAAIIKLTEKLKLSDGTSGEEAQRLKQQIKTEEDKWRRKLQEKENEKQELSTKLRDIQALIEQEKQYRNDYIEKLRTIEKELTEERNNSKTQLQSKEETFNQERLTWEKKFKDNEETINNLQSKLKKIQKDLETKKSESSLSSEEELLKEQTDKLIIESERLEEKLGSFLEICGYFTSKVHETAKDPALVIPELKHEDIPIGEFSHKPRYSIFSPTEGEITESANIVENEQDNKDTSG